MEPIDNLHWSEDAQKRLSELHEARNLIDLMVEEAVGESRIRGVSWAEIGKALGISRQTAWERFH